MCKVWRPNAISHAVLTTPVAPKAGNMFFPENRELNMLDNFSEVTQLINDRDSIHIQVSLTQCTHFD